MVTVRYFAAARDAAGQRSEDVTAASVADLVDDLVERHGPRMADVLAVSSLVSDGARIDRDHPLTADDCVDVLPPFAGG